MNEVGLKLVGKTVLPRFEISQVLRLRRTALAQNTTGVIELLEGQTSIGSLRPRSQVRLVDICGNLVRFPRITRVTTTVSVIDTTRYRHQEAAAELSPLNPGVTER